jgi:hypothetical protein
MAKDELHKQEESIKDQAAAAELNIQQDEIMAEDADRIVGGQHRLTSPPDPD